MCVWEWKRKELGGRGRVGGWARAHRTVKKNAVPNDPRPPMVTSGLRIGTPAVTTRGFKQPEVVQLSHWIADVLDHMGDESVVERVRGEVLSLNPRVVTADRKSTRLNSSHT